MLGVAKSILGIVDSTLYAGLQKPLHRQSTCEEEMKRTQEAIIFEATTDAFKIAVPKF